MSASACSFWPTSRASQGGADETARQGGPTLQSTVAQWASPQARLGDNRGADAKRWGDEKRRGGWNLDDQVAALWPSPQAHDAASPKTPEQIAHMKQTAAKRQGGGPPGVRNLNEVASTWPTACAADARGSSGKPGPNKQVQLVDAVKDWPTPASRDYRTPNSQDSQDRRNAESTRGQQLPNFVEHVLPTTWGTPSTMDAKDRTYSWDGGEKGAERPTLNGQAEAFPSIPQARPTASSGAPSSPAGPSSLRLSPEFVEWLMGWPPGWTIQRPGSLLLGQIASEPPGTAWSHWLLLQRTWLSMLSWSYAPAPEAPAMRQMELI